MSASRTDRTLVFHIGHQKTGTTTIQNALAAGRIKLRDMRILYTARMAHNYLKQHVARFAADGSVAMGRPGMPGLPEIARLLETEEYDYAVFSGEAFADFNADDLRKAMRQFMLPHVTDHRVLCYLRPHAARVLSSFAEQTKVGLHHGTLAEYHDKSLKNERFRYDMKLAPWVTAFGTAFVVRPMVRNELAQGSVLHDFVQTAFGSAVEAQIEAGTDANESLCLEDLMLVKIVQGVIAQRNKGIRLELGWAIATKLLGEADPTRSRTKLKMHRALAERIRTDYAEDARRTDRRFFGGRPILQGELDRAVEESVATPMSVEPSDYFTADEVRAIRTMAELVNDMLDRQPKQWPAFFLNRRAEGVQ